MTHDQAEHAAGDLAGFGDLVADDFVEHRQVAEGLPPTKEGTLDFFRALLVAFLTST